MHWTNCCPGHGVDGIVFLSHQRALGHAGAGRRLGVTRPRHDRPVMFCCLLSLTIEPGPRSGKALNARRQNHPGLGRRRPDVAGDVNGIGVVVAAARDGTHLRPALEGQPDGGAAAWAKVNKDFFLAAVRHMLVPTQLTVIELDGIQREDRFRKEGRARYALAELAVAGKGTRGRLVGTESNLAAEAATF